MRFDLLCRCENCEWDERPDPRVGCLRYATGEDGLCDGCRSRGPRAVSDEIRVANDWDEHGWVIGWKVVTRRDR